MILTADIWIICFCGLNQLVYWRKRVPLCIRIWRFHWLSCIALMYKFHMLLQFTSSAKFLIAPWAWQFRKEHHLILPVLILYPSVPIYFCLLEIWRAPEALVAGKVVLVLASMFLWEEVRALRTYFLCNDETWSFSSECDENISWHSKQRIRFDNESLFLPASSTGTAILETLSSSFDLWSHDFRMWNFLMLIKVFFIGEKPITEREFARNSVTFCMSQDMIRVCVKSLQWQWAQAAFKGLSMQSKDMVVQHFLLIKYLATMLANKVFDLTMSGSKMCEHFLLTAK